MTGTKDPEIVLRVEALHKTFGDLVANKDVCLEIHKGEIHCLLGENGAGKSTLCKCICGNYKADSGKIFVRCQEVSISSPSDAISLRIGMVHQHFVLVPPMTVLENIIVGTRGAGLLLDLPTARKKIEHLLNMYQLEIDLDARVDSLSVGQQQWVEILKALYEGVDILILDEPTAALTPQETASLFKILRQMTSEGMSVILITHKLYEVMDISDRVTVLRKGMVIATRHTSTVDRAELARLMVGHDVSFRVQKEKAVPGDVVFSLKQVHVLKDNGAPALVDFSLDIHRNQILGLAGVGGNGQDELFDVIVGVRNLVSGELLMGGRNISALSPAERFHLGLASIPPDRIRQGLLMNFSVSDNLILGFQHGMRFSNGIFINDKKVKDFAAEAISSYDVATTGPDQAARLLSGGNLQKLILARELSHKVEFVLASCPTRGLDVGAMQYVHERLVQLRDKGAGIFLVSEDLDEILNVADRIAVIHKGQVMGIFDAEEVTRQEIGLLMAGVQSGAV